MKLSTEQERWGKQPLGYEPDVPLTKIVKGDRVCKGIIGSTVFWEVIQIKGVSKCATD